MKTYKIQDRQAGNTIVRNLNFEQAQELLNDYESQDKANNCFEVDFYVITEEE
jgi:Tfp pilus assembly protein PilX